MNRLITIEFGDRITTYCQEIRCILTFLDVDKLRTMENDYNRIAERLLEIFGKQLLEQLDSLKVFNSNPKLEKSVLRSHSLKHTSRHQAPNRLGDCTNQYPDEIRFLCKSRGIFPTGISDFIREFKLENLNFPKSSIISMNNREDSQQSMATIIGQDNSASTIHLWIL